MYIYWYIAKVLWKHFLKRHQTEHKGSWDHFRSRESGASCLYMYHWIVCTSYNEWKHLQLSNLLLVSNLFLINLIKFDLITFVLRKTKQKNFHLCPTHPYLCPPGTYTCWLQGRPAAQIRLLVYPHFGRGQSVTSLPDFAVAVQMVMTSFAIMTCVFCLLLFIRAARNLRTDGETQVDWCTNCGSVVVVVVVNQ